MSFLPFTTDNDGHVEVTIHGPDTAFGEVVVATPTPRVQIDAIYGLLATDVETLTASGGAATAPSGIFRCTTGTSVGGYGVVRSRRIGRYRPGQGMRIRFTARFPSAATALSFVMAGAFNAEDGLFVGYSGATFGVLRRVAGATHIARLTITTGAGGVETVTVTLNGVAFATVTAGALSTTALAEALAESATTYTGWTSIVSPTSNGATVTWIQQNPAVCGGAFTLSSTGTAAGTFATVQAGAANDNSTGFVAKSAWNVDRLDGSNGQYNPSGMTLDVTKLNVWQFLIPYLGAGTIWLQVMTPNGEIATVHRFEYPNSATIPSFRNPTLRVGWVSASLGSTTDLTIEGASAAAFSDGPLVSARDPFSVRNASFSAGTTEYVALAIRCRGEFGGVLNQREILPNTIIVGNETGNRLVLYRVVLNPTISGTVNWGYVDQAQSAVEYATPSSVAATGGREIGGDLVSDRSEFAASQLDIRMEPGDVLAICVSTVSLTATCAVIANWQER